MKKDFIEKVLKARTFDTDKYHYTVRIRNGMEEIERIDADVYQTSSAVDGWETVWKQTDKSKRLEVHNVRKCNKCGRIIFKTYRIKSILGIAFCEQETVRPFRPTGIGYLCADCYSKLIDRG